jgi:hypothetical protein
MPRYMTVLIDVVAIIVLTLVIYFPRYRRRDMVVAYIGLNIGVLTVAVALSQTTTIGTGFGLGLFGALSIIRLRSDELGHQDVSFYFAALALGLICGIEVQPEWISIALPIAVLVAMYLGDHPALFRGYRRQTVTMGRAYTDEAELTTALADLLQASVRRIEIRRVDLVNDSTTVDVRYRLHERGAW